MSGDPRAGWLSRLTNQLNLVPTRPASLIWLSIKYHFQPSVPTGGFWPMTQAIGFYLVSGAMFFFVGSYMFKQALDIWFQETYRHGWDFRMIAGAFLFWNTIYLLRFGLFVVLTALVSAAAIYPVKVVCAAGAFGGFVLQFLSEPFAGYLDHHFGAAAAALVLGLALMAFEHDLVDWGRRSRLGRGVRARREAREQAALDQIRRDPHRALAVVYMSGDDLSFHKLTPELLISRLQTLRDRLGSGGLRLLAQAQALPDDAELTQRFKALYELEQRGDVTLWHPLQVVLAGEEPPLADELGLNLRVAGGSERERVLAAWHLRRWLVTMMSTAGHAQDTGINLVDIALGLAREGLGANTVFYLIQNKYDNQDHNRPAQLPYDQGELGQRNKLARLLMAVAPGSRAYSLNDWTPFGFKAGGLVGMDLVYEESLKLTNMLLLDRNANAHDLEAVMADLKLAISDPGVVIVIPGRSTTNTLTPVGQSSQLVEEGQRALTRGVMLVGGVGAETLGTGWGNIQAIYYGRVQRALCDTSTPKMPLTAAAARGAHLRRPLRGADWVRSARHRHFRGYLGCYAGGAQRPGARLPGQVPAVPGDVAQAPGVLKPCRVALSLPTVVRGLPSDDARPNHAAHQRRRTAFRFCQGDSRQRRPLLFERPLGAPEHPADAPGDHLRCLSVCANPGAALEPRFAHEPGPDHAGVGGVP